MIWRAGMSGQTRSGATFRVIADDALGMAGPLITLVRMGMSESVVRYPRNGVHIDQPSLDLMTVRAKAPA